MRFGLVPEEALSIDFWKRLEPALNIEGGAATPEFPVPDPATLNACLRFEGYVNVPDVLPPPLVERARKCVENLHGRDIPVPFAFVFDELWQAFQGLSKFLEAALDGAYQALPAFWVWYVAPKEAASGWAPHRDRPIPTVDADNSPHSLTVWLPFTDATPLNGCVYMLPAHLDERFERRDWQGAGVNTVKHVQDVRALPATAGSMLAWNQGVLHWGGRASQLSPIPRVSAAFEFQRGDKPPFSAPLLDAKRLPPFRQRLALIGKQLLQYRHMHPLSLGLAELAETLRDG